MKTHLALFALLSLSACSSPSTADDAATAPDASTPDEDASSAEVDAAVPEDAFTPPPDAFTPRDAAPFDGGPPATWDEVYAIFDSTTCGGGTTGCHYTGSAGALSLRDSATACAQLLHADRTASCRFERRVVAGSLDESLLYQKLLGPVAGCGDRMPDGRTPLTEEEISVVGRWILAGAVCP